MKSILRNYFVDAIYNDDAGADSSGVSGSFADHAQFYFGADAGLSSLGGNSAKISVTHLGGTAYKYTITVDNEVYSGRTFKVFRIYVKAGANMRRPINYNVTANTWNGFISIENDGYLSISTVEPKPIIQTTPTGTVIFSES